jgi:hypothetical protein
MKAQTPANKVTKIGEFRTCEGYRTICECTSEDHSVDTWIEVGELFEDYEDVYVTFHVNTYSHPLAMGFWQRVKNAAKVLFGVDQRQQEIILTKQQAINWCKAVETTAKKLEKKNASTKV